MRIYKIQQQGGAYYIALPKPLISESMLQNGVYVEVLHYDKNVLTIRVTAAKEEKGAKLFGEHPKSDKTNRKNT